MGTPTVKREDSSASTGLETDMQAREEGSPAGDKQPDDEHISEGGQQHMDDGPEVCNKHCPLIGVLTLDLGRDFPW